MGIWSKVKAVFSREQFLDSSIRMMEGSGTYGAKPHPFNYHLAMTVALRSWAYRCVVGNAEAAARVPLRLYVRKRSDRELKLLGYKSRVFMGKAVSKARMKYLTGQAENKPSSRIMQKLMEFGEDFEEVTDHPVIDVLRRVNPDINGYDLSVGRFVAIMATGNAYLHPVMSQVLNRPTELWPLLPQWTQIVPGSADSGNLIDGYVYGQTMNERTPFARDEVLRFTSGTYRDSLFYAVGPTEANWHALGLIYARATMDKATYDNMARPDWLLVNENATPDQAKQGKQQIDAQLRGPRNAGKWLYVGGKISATAMQFAPKDLVVPERYLEEIAGVYGYPITKLLANDPNRANAETGDAGWMKDTVLPMLRRDEEALNQNGFLALFGDGQLVDDAVLAYDDPVPSNKKLELVESRTLVTAGIRTVNEDRRLRGDEPMEGGDELRVNGMPFSALGQQPAAPFSFNLPAPVQQQPDPGIASVAEAMKAVADAMGKALEQINKSLSTQDGTKTREQDGNGTSDESAGRHGDGAGRKGRGGAPNEPVDQGASAGNESDRDTVHRGDDADEHPGGSGDEIKGATDEGEQEATPADDGSGSGVHGRKQLGEADDAADSASGDSGGICGSEDGAKDDEKATAETITKHSDLIYGKCECEHTDAMPFTFKGWKASADDTAREDQPENPVEQMARAIAGALSELESDLLKRLKNGKRWLAKKDLTPDEIEKIIRELEAQFAAKMADAIEPYMQRMIDAGGSAAINNLGGRVSAAFDVSNPLVRDFIRNHTLRLVGELREATLTRVQSVLVEGVTSGQSTRDIAKRIEETGQFSPARAEAIARTESATAYVEGEKQGWNQSGIVRGSKWLLAPAACPFCQAAAAKFANTVQPLDKPFFAKGETITTAQGTMKLDYRDVTGPPLHPNDRCDLEPVLDDE